MFMRFSLPVVTIFSGFAILILVGQGCVAQSNTELETEDGAMMQDSDVMMGQEDSMMAEDEVMKDDEMMDNQDSMSQSGTYQAFSADKLVLANDGNVVLFFRASWCPSCKAVDADIKSNLTDIPSDLTILDVNYDTETALKQKYGVTYQHTFVQVDAEGNQIAKWSGSPTLSDIVSKVE
jgi:thiol-disulfide isomerase/thioredoxin